MRVLLIAEAANPEWASVPLVGWSCARALAHVVDTHLVTQVRNREAILRAGLVEGRDFTAIDSEAIARPIYRLGQLLRGGQGKGWTTITALSSLTYPYFEWLLWRELGHRIASGEFDLVHRITPLSPTAPSLLARRCRRVGIPFVLGPLNGGLPWPQHFDRVRREEREWLSYVRSLHKLLPHHRSTWRHAAAILVGSIATWNQIPSKYDNNKYYIVENAIDPGRFAGMPGRRAILPVRAVFVGRLAHYKGADMLLEAAAPVIRHGGLTLDVVGDGPQLPELRERIRQEGIESGVKLHGWVEHAQVADFLAGHDVLTFPSIREFGGGVVLEAMAMGLVPVVVNYGGPGELATEGTGFLIPLGNRSQIIDRLRTTLRHIVSDPSQLGQKSRAAIQRIHHHFTWEAKARQILEVYRWVLGEGSAKPNFPMPLPDEADVTAEGRVARANSPPSPNVRSLEDSHPLTDDRVFRRR